MKHILSSLRLGTPSTLSLYLSTSLFLILPLGSLTLVGCSTGDGDGDAGDGDGDAGGGGVPCDGAAYSAGVDLGASGLNFIPIEAGSEVATWPRPQGGIGTRFNINILGFAEDAEFESLNVNIYGVATSAGSPGEEGGSCSAECAAGLACFADVCRLVISDQVNRLFPKACLGNGSLQVTELPLAFKNSFSLSDLDGKEADIYVVLTPTIGDPVTDNVNVILQVGEFVQPSWWDDSNP